MKRILFLLTLIGLLSVNLFSQEIPKQFNYQGVLKEGSVLVDGNYPFTFRIYNEPTGGSALWTESQTILVENGLFSAQLGSTTPIAGVPFNRVHFLGITVGTGAELTPRTMLTPSPYSFMSMDVMDEAITTAKIHDGAVTGDKIGANQVVKSLNGIKDDVTLVGGTNITLTPSGNNITISAAGGGGGTGTIGGSGTVNYIPRFTADTTLGNSAIYQSATSNIGIGTTEPSSKLDIRDGHIHINGHLTFTNSSGVPFNDCWIGANNDGTDDWLHIGGITTSSVRRIGLWADRVYFDGNVGIGTTTPTMKLDVMGDVSTGLLHLKPQDNVDEGGELLLSGAGSYNEWRMDANQNNLRLFTNSTNPNQVKIFNNGSGSAGLYVEGNVGIGTSAPQDILHVVRSSYNLEGMLCYRRNNPYPIVGGFGAGTAGINSNSRGFLGANVYGSITYNHVYGVYGKADLASGGSSYGIYGEATGLTTNYGIYATATGGTTNWAGYFAGNMRVTGIINPSAIESMIDHPLDPANKYLYHAVVESPDMKNIYDGNVITDGSGYATVTLPDWFEALNKDLRYQLTVIGDFAQAIIAQEVQGNQFAIRTDKPNIKVSWQVTGIRKDAFAEKNRTPVEVTKQGNEVGKYIHPDAFGLPESMGIDYEKNNPER